MLRDTLDGWIMSTSWPARRRLRFRLGLLLYAGGVRRLAVRVADLPVRNITKGDDRSSVSHGHSPK